MSKIKLKLEKLDKALSSLEKIYLKPIQEDRSNIDATIQRFELVIELFWKMLKLFLHDKGLEVLVTSSSRDLITGSTVFKVKRKKYYF